MKLTEIKSIGSLQTSDFVVSKFDGLQPDDGTCYEDFDVLVTYEWQDEGYSTHPYGDGFAREKHGISLSVVSIVTNEDVILSNCDDDTVVTVFAKGTRLDSMPGWNDTLNKYFENLAFNQVDD